jgi:hypothetical protein
MLAVHFASQVFPSYQSITISWTRAKTQFRCQHCCSGTGSLWLLYITTVNGVDLGIGHCYAAVAMVMTEFIFLIINPFLTPC